MGLFTCVSCSKHYKSFKSLHRHKKTKHPETIQHKQDRIENYNLNPSRCKRCDVKLDYDHRHNSFCTHSCAALFNNENRTNEVKQKCIQTWRKKLVILNRDIPGGRPYNKAWGKPHIKKYPVNRICKSCGNEFVALHHKHIYCKPSCNNSKHGKACYRFSCRFNLSPAKFPELFNSLLIREYGWYNPTNKPGPTNLTGVCWDHLFRVEDGYKLDINPYIMQHPANAELVPWKVNKNRKSSLITLNQLHERIQKWESGERTLPRFLE